MLDQTLVIPIPLSAYAKDLTYIQFGKLLPLFPVGRTAKNRYIIWHCRCACGNYKNVSSNNLSNGGTSSCGCIANRFNPQNSSKHPLYSTWKNMRARCNSRNASGYRIYGGRGIKVCSAWNSFQQFIRDMGNPPTNKHSIDRIDPDGDYTPANCRWATRTQQAENRRTTARNAIHHYTYKGVTGTGSYWAKKLKFTSSQSLLNRRYRGWTDEEIITIPLGKYRRDYT